MTRRRSGGEPGLGEAIVVWIVCSLLLVALVTTYARLAEDDLYRVDRAGISGGLSRMLVATNFPVALIAIGLALVSLDALPRRAWWFGGPAIALCALTAVPGVVDQHDLDARPVNALPAVGVGLAVGLTAVAVKRVGAEWSPNRALDGARAVLTGLIVVVSIPWVLADLGVYGPEWIFIMERPIMGDDGTLSAAVHLGHHHGLDGALFALAAIALSRAHLTSPRLAVVTTSYLGLLFAYGIVNLVQDGWNEQLAKRRWVDTTIPGALTPALTPIWLVIVVIATAASTALWRERSVATGGDEASSDVPGELLSR